MGLRSLSSQTKLYFHDMPLRFQFEDLQFQFPYYFVEKDTKSRRNFPPTPALLYIILNESRFLISEPNYPKKRSIDLLNLSVSFPYLPTCPL